MQLREFVSGLTPRLSAEAWLRVALAVLLALIPIVAFPGQFWAAFPGALALYAPFATADGDHSIATLWFLQSRGWAAIAAIVLAAIGVAQTTKRSNEAAFYAALLTFYVGVLWPVLGEVFAPGVSAFNVAHGEPGWLLPAITAAVSLTVIGLTSRRAVELAPTSGLAGAAVYFERRPAVMLALGFAAGLPNLLVFDTLSAWLRTAGVSLQIIGFFALATLSYSLKFLWAPLIDRTPIPGLSALIGHRRSWMLVCQAAIIVGLWLISGSNPTANLGLVAAFAIFVAFASATQDIVIDAWRIEAVGEERQGAMAAAYQWGYRIAILTAGVAPLFIASRVNWGVAYATMAVLMIVGMLAVLAAPKEKPRPEMPPLMPADMPAKPGAEAVEWIVRLAVLLTGALIFGTGFTGQLGMLQSMFGEDALAQFAEAWASRPGGVLLQVAFSLAGLVLIVFSVFPMPGRSTRPGVYFVRSYWHPIKDFLVRFSGVAGLILAMICAYRLSDFVLNIMNPFYLDVGFSLETIAEIRKVFGVVMLSIGVAAAGWSVARFGLMRSLIAGAFAGPASNLMFAWLATQGPSLSAFATAIAVDNITAGYSGTVLIAYMSSLTSAGFTATQYALFSSLYALPGKLIGAQSGSIVEASARAAEGGGLLAPLTALFANIPTSTFVRAADIGVSPQALGAGYVLFFFYSCAIGVFALVLALVIARRQKREEKAPEEPTPA